MRRLSSSNAVPGMVLGRTVFDSSGRAVCLEGEALDSGAVTRLSIYGIREVFIEDPRLQDIHVEPAVAPEIEAEAERALKELTAECYGEPHLDGTLLDQAVRPVSVMAQRMFPVLLGDPNTAPCTSPDEAHSRTPARAAGLAALLAAKCGMGPEGAETAGLAALLMDIGYIRIAADVPAGRVPGALVRAKGMQKHPAHGYLLLKESLPARPGVAQAVLEHHERADGSGYPRALKGREMSRAGRVVAVVDAFFELVTPVPGIRPMLRHQAVEYLMAYGGQLFDPEVVDAFARNVPAYPAGVLVTLNTGESGVVADTGSGHVGRPVVRVLFNDMGYEVARPYDLDLADSKERDRMITGAPEY